MSLLEAGSQFAHLASFSADLPTELVVAAFGLLAIATIGVLLHSRLPRREKPKSSQIPPLSPLGLPKLGIRPGIRHGAGRQANSRWN